MKGHLCVWETDNVKERGNVTTRDSLYRSGPHTAVCEQVDTGQERKLVCLSRK